MVRYKSNGGKIVHSHQLVSLEWIELRSNVGEKNSILWWWYEQMPLWLCINDHLVRTWIFTVILIWFDWIRKKKKIQWNSNSRGNEFRWKSIRFLVGPTIQNPNNCCRTSNTIWSFDKFSLVCSVKWAKWGWS